MVDRVTRDKSRNLKVEIRLNIIELANTRSNSDDPTDVQVSKDGIYTHIPDLYRAGVIVITI